MGTFWIFSWWRCKKLEGGVVDTAAGCHPPAPVLTPLKSKDHQHHCLHGCCLHGAPQIFGGRLTDQASETQSQAKNNGEYDKVTVDRNSGVIPEPHPMVSGWYNDVEVVGEG